MDTAPGTLIDLKDTTLILADPADDLRGRTVVDRSGDEVGAVDGLIIDEQERRARFLQVGSGGFLGLGEKKQLVPVDAITSIDENSVQISTGREHVAGGPVYDPDVVPQAQYYQDLYDYYGYAPFWAPGYLPPGFRR